MLSKVESMRSLCSSRYSLPRCSSLTFHSRMSRCSSKNCSIMTGPHLWVSVKASRLEIVPLTFSSSMDVLATWTASPSMRNSCTDPVTFLRVRPRKPFFSTVTRSASVFARSYMGMRWNPSRFSCFVMRPFSSSLTRASSTSALFRKVVQTIAPSVW